MNLYVLSAITSGWDTCDLIHREVHVNGYIGLSNDRSNADVSGYFFAKDKCKKADIPFYEVSTYNLSKGNDKRLLLSLGIDVLVVAGWQRLIPKYLIEHCKICAVGLHGSPLGITYGRGRSPQNWALIMGMQDFEVCIFKINSGIDSGEIIAARKFKYSPKDDIRTSYLKTSFLMAEMTIEAIKTGLIWQKGVDQDEREARYLPQRRPADGMIDWTRKANEIVNFIRALTKPYPGAFTTFQNHKIQIWDGIEFTGIDEGNSYCNGELIHQYAEGELLIKCSDGAVIVKSYDSDFNFDNIPNIIFDSANFSAQLQNIIQEHYQKYPNLKVSDDLLIT